MVNVRFGNNVRINLSSPIGGYIAYWNGDDALSSGGNLTSWLDRTRKHVLQPDTGQTCAVGADDAAYDNKKSIGTVGVSSQRLVTIANIDLSNTDKLHVFVRARTGDNAATKIVCEHSATSGSGNGFAIFANSDEDWGAQCAGAVGQSRELLSPSDSTVVATIENINDKGLSQDEAKIKVNGVVGNTRLVDDDNLDNFSADKLYVLGRSDGSLPSIGSIRHILIYPFILTDTQAAFNRELLAIL